MEFWLGLRSVAAVTFLVASLALTAFGSLVPHLPSIEADDTTTTLVLLERLALDHQCALIASLRLHLFCHAPQALNSRCEVDVWSCFQHTNHGTVLFSEASQQQDNLSLLVDLLSDRLQLHHQLLQVIQVLCKRCSGLHLERVQLLRDGNLVAQTITVEVTLQTHSRLHRGRRFTYVNLVNGLDAQSDQAQGLIKVFLNPLRVASVPVLSNAGREGALEQALHGKRHAHIILPVEVFVSREAIVVTCVVWAHNLFA
ncbi:TPA: hypothetical protein N0F65_006006 [Lagenidium giganteum]|uniref:Secreted protein n=1 Tax=Lagenidium giganteum TaxID=4803 RepID=A0AAV2Z3B7_9STRA|nr:TPA: hypothetical protein N0F65_006006 [Lagenidium giganteum]